MPTHVFRALSFSHRLRPATGFALPTVLIVATVMLVVLLASIQSSVSVNQSISAQYIEKLGKAAADSGLAMARACYTSTNPNSVLWGATVSGGAATALKAKHRLHGS